MVCGVFQQIKSIHHSSFLYENSDFPTLFPATFSSRVCHQGAYIFGSPVLTLTVLVTTIDAQWEGMGDVGSASYELALLLHARP